MQVALMLFSDRVEVVVHLHSSQISTLGNVHHIQQHRHSHHCVAAAAAVYSDPIQMSEWGEREREPPPNQTWKPNLIQPKYLSLMRSRCEGLFNFRKIIILQFIFLLYFFF